MNKIKMDCLLKYIEKTLDEKVFTNLDDYIEILVNLNEVTKDQLLDVQDNEEKIKSLQNKYLKKKLTNLKDKKNYQKCINLCDEFLSSNNKKYYYYPDYIKREIKHIKIDCLKEISDILIQQNKKDEFMKKIEEISLLQREIDYGLGENKGHSDLINIMLEIIKEKAENFNKNNLYDISEKISELGLQIDPNNIDLLHEKSISNTKKRHINESIDNNDKILSIEPYNLSARLNKINNISELVLKDINQKYIYYLIQIITNTKLIDEDTKVLAGRAIEILTDLIKQYGDEIYSFFKDEIKTIFFQK